jgi:hypothetical protein
MYKPGLREQKEFETECTFQPKLKSQIASANRQSVASANKENNVARRRSPEEFIRDMRVMEEQRKVKLDMLHENLYKQE